MRIAFVLIFLSTCPLLAQFRSVEQEFIQYLIQSRQYEEAVTVVNEKLTHSDRISEKDSLHFLLGRTYYSLQKLEEANKAFEQVTRENDLLYAPTVFLYSYNCAYLGRYGAARYTLNAYSPSSSELGSLKVLQLAGFSILEKDFHTFDSLKQYFTYDRIDTQQQFENLLIYRNDMKSLKRKSPLVAGVLSGLIPGAGRVYGGKKATGIYSLIAGTLLGLQVYEGYKKDGLKSARFIIYGSLFSVFYIGNIWGSIVTIKVARDEKEEAIRHQVLIDMHIPLRTIFQ
jgi:tetratricopeptide (TPR) repeat protein